MSAMDELRAALLAAAHRDVEAHRARTRRRRRRTTGAILLVLLGGAAAAGAADLISVGEPLPDERTVGPDRLPAPGEPVRAELTAPSGDRKLPYAVGTYTAVNGERCALAGHARAGVLGTVKDGVFRPYREHTGSCARPGRPVFSSMAYDGRTLVHGITGSAASVVHVAGTDVERRIGPNRPFLFVFDGEPPPSGYVVEFG